MANTITIYDTSLAKVIYYYYRVNQHFLIENGLDDDSNSITVDELVNYVDNHIDQEDKDRLYRYCTEAY